MALLNKDGHYIKIENVDLSGLVIYRVYKDESQRTNWSGEFETTRQEFCMIDSELLNEKTPGDVSLKSAMIMTGYNGMKRLEQFSDCIDI